jgi:thioredoxin 1
VADLNLNFRIAEVNVAEARIAGMPLLTTDAADGPALARALASADRPLIVCLCAAWCDTCEEFKLTFERLANADASAAYLWIDIEDDGDLLGDIDVENFPTLAVFRGGVTLFYGVTLPQEGVVARTLASLSGRTSGAPGVPEAVKLLLPALKRALPA